MKIQCLAFGKLRTPGVRDTADHYLARIRGFAPISEFELKPFELPPSKSSSQRAVALDKEAELLKKRLQLRNGAWVPFVCLDENGPTRSSREWSAWMNEMQESWNEITFILGSSVGIHPDIKNHAKARISLGPQTLPHELARVVLYEQIFRALTLIKGHPYHND